MAITDSQVEMNRRLYSGQQVGLMGVPIGKPNSTSPIRTRREVVPGVYGHVKVSNNPDAGLVVYLPLNNYNAEELREAAHLFNQLAEVLEENQ